MFLRELGQSITVLRGAGTQVAARLARLGIYTIADLILFYPRDYDDRTSFVPLASFAREARVRTVAEYSDPWPGAGRSSGHQTVFVTLSRPTVLLPWVATERGTGP